MWLSWSLEGPPPLGALASGPHEYAHYHQDSVLAHLTISRYPPLIQGVWVAISQA